MHVYVYVNMLCTFVNFSDRFRSFKLPIPNIQVFKSDLENIVLNDKTQNKSSPV